MSEFQNPKRKLVLIDGMAILHRAFHAYPINLSTKTGEVINAVYGFTAILLTVLEKLKPTHVIVTWDVGEPTFRHEEYVEYKATREKPDELLLGQIARTQQVVEALNMPQFGVGGYEADDLIGTLAEQAIKVKGQRSKVKGGEPAAHLDAQVVIVTGDRDALQLIKDEKIIVYMPPATGRYAKDRGPMIFDETAFETKYGIKPKQMIDLKGLMGDASDNIPGVRGVGPKTATELLQKFGSVEEIYKRIGEVEKPRTKQLLTDGKESALMSKKLATIKTDVPIVLDWEKCKLSDYDRERVMELFEELQFKSLINKLPKDVWEEELDAVFSSK